MQEATTKRRFRRKQCTTCRNNRQRRCRSPACRNGRSMSSNKIASSAGILLCFVGQVTGQGLSFIWWFDQQNDASIGQCDTLNIATGPATNGSAPAAVPPYYLITYPADATPQVFDASAANGNGGIFAWQMGYQTGTSLMLGMVDSKGNSGGIVRLYTVSGGSSNCQLYSTTNSDFSFSVNPPSQPRTCQDVDFTVTGGIPPYTVTTAVSMDSGVNQTFTNGNISVKNQLSGGASYILALSDSTGAYAASPDVIYSGGGGDTSCLVSNPSTTSSGSSSSTSNPDKNGGGSSSKMPAIVGAIVAVAALVIAGAVFLWYRRRKQAQHAEFIAARLSGMNGGGSSNGSSSGGREGREKFVSPLSAHGSGGGGGMWRPESPTEYPGITSAPVRFRVTNPDDDARSERSFRGIASRSGGAGGGGLRDSQDTLRSSSKPWSSSDGTTGSYRGGDRSQRRSLIESDANALYPPTASYRNITPSSSSSPTRSSGPPSAGSTGSFEDADQPWPTYSSAASSETEDHYADFPASSAGILGAGRQLQQQQTIAARQASMRSVGPPANDEMDVEDMCRDEVYSPASYGTGMDAAWDSHTRPGGMTSSSSNAYGSPFADSQRVQ